LAHGGIVKHRFPRRNRALRESPGGLQYSQSCRMRACALVRLLISFAAHDRRD
jgi:hypothetical protein